MPTDPPAVADDAAHSTSDSPIDEAIGGRSPDRTERGFAIYGRVVDTYESVTRVTRSSAMGEPRCWVFTADSAGRDVVPCSGVPHGFTGVSPHLDAEQARQLAAALLRFADDAEPGVAPPPAVVSAEEAAAIAAMVRLYVRRHVPSCGRCGEPSTRRACDPSPGGRFVRICDNSGCAEAASMCANCGFVAARPIRAAEPCSCCGGREAASCVLAFEDTPSALGLRAIARVLKASP